MEVKRVLNRSCLLLLLLFSSKSFSQDKKYLLFDKSKDSIVTVNGAANFRIDKNLFNTDRYNSVDTIILHKNCLEKIATVKLLWKEGRRLHRESVERGVHNNVIQVLETYNQIFEYIYVLEKIEGNQYKRTRVWWVDY